MTKASGQEPTRDRRATTRAGDLRQRACKLTAITRSIGYLPVVPDCCPHEGLVEVKERELIAFSVVIMDTHS